MNQVASKIVNKMLMADLISEKETEEYNYGVQILLEKVISYFIIFLLAVILNRFLEISIFLISFSLLRKYSGGIHCSSFVSCMIISTAVSLSSVLLLPLMERWFSIYQGGLIMSIIIVVVIGSINNPNIDWSGSEYRKAKRLSRLMVVMEITVLILLLELRFPFHYRFFIGYGIVVCAISMLLEIQKKGGIAYEES